MSADPLDDYVRYIGLAQEWHDRAEAMPLKYWTAPNGRYRRAYFEYRQAHMRAGGYMAAAKRALARANEEGHEVQQHRQDPARRQSSGPSSESPASLWERAAALPLSVLRGLASWWPSPPPGE